MVLSEALKRLKTRQKLSAAALCIHCLSFSIKESLLLSPVSQEVESLLSSKCVALNQWEWEPLLSTSSRPGLTLGLEQESVRRLEELRRCRSVSQSQELYHENGDGHADMNPVLPQQ